jgi:hypothetical protein
MPHEDGYHWRKYGEKQINGTHFTRYTFSLETKVQSAPAGLFFKKKEKCQHLFNFQFLYMLLFCSHYCIVCLVFCDHLDSVIKIINVMTSTEVFAMHYYTETTSGAATNMTEVARPQSKYNSTITAIRQCFR